METFNAGDHVVCVIQRSLCAPRLGAETTVKTVSPSVIVTDDGRSWHVGTRQPVKEGRNSGKTLTSIHDPLVVTLRAKLELARIASQASNLEALPRTAPDEVYADLSALIRAARDAQDAVLVMMREASRARQASER